MNNSLKSRLIKLIPIFTIIAFACFVIGLVLMDTIIMPLIVGAHRGNTIVPKIVKLTTLDALEAIKTAGLTLQKEKEEYCDSVPEKLIIDQHPEAGSEVKKHRIIYYTVSKGSKIVAVPNLKGKSIRQAQLTLKSYGLVCGKIRYSFNDSVGPDCVIHTDPLEGVTKSRGTTVSLYVSQGPEAKESIVPNLVGLPLSIALEEIERAGLTKGSVTFAIKKELNPETVISQSVSPGKKIDKGLEINLIVSSQN